MKEIHLEVVDSTNTYLKNNYADLENFTIVSADTQTDGRGRNSRIWNSDGNNLLFSLLIKDHSYFDRYKTISILSAYSVLQALKNLGIDDVSIKWPNDVYIGDRKVCGILLEAISREKLECLIVGVGINVNQREFADYTVKATSVRNELDRDIDLEEFKNRIYSGLIDNLKLLNDDYDFYNEIVKYDYLKNREVYALINKEKRMIKVLGINKDYSLHIECDEKELDIETGEISFHM